VRLSKATVAENVPVGAVVGTLDATGLRIGDRCTFTLVDGDGAAGNGAFRIVGSRLVTASAIDFERTPSFTVRVRATNRGGISSERVFTIAIRNVKEQPSVVVPPSFAAVEDTPAKMIFTGTPFAVDAAAPSTRITVTLRIGQGTIRAGSAAGVVVGGTGHARTFTGSLDALNAYFTDPQGRIVYTPAADDCGTRTLTVAVTEWYAGGVVASSATVPIVIAPVADAPRITTPDLFRVIEDRPTKLDWNVLGRAFADPDSSSLQVTLSVAGGRLDAVSGRGVTVGGDAMHRTLTGSPVALAAFAALGRISYTTAPDATAPVTLEVEASDGDCTVHRDVPIVVTPQPDRPVLAATGTLFGPASSAREISHADLLGATGARDADGNDIRFIVENVQGGRLETWNGSQWVPVRVAPRYFTTSASRVTLVGPTTRLRWVADAGASVRPSITLRAWDGTLASGSTCRVGFGDA
jgi:hypothetical protein